MNRIRELRKMNKMTLRQLAGKIDISIVFLSDIERGNRHGSEATRKRIADALGVDVSELES